MNTPPTLYSFYANLKSNGADQTEERTDTSETVKGQNFNGRLYDITQFWLSENELGDCLPTGQIAASRQTIIKRYGLNSLLLRRNVYQDNSRKPYLQLEIQSDTLQGILREVAYHLCTVNVHANPIIIKAPYHELYHFRKEFAAARASLSSSSVKAKLLKTELEELQKFVDENLGPAITEIEALKSCHQISMEYLWAIFKPGEPVLLRQQEIQGQLETCCGITQSYRIKPDNSGNWCLKIKHWSFESGRFGVVEQEYEFAPFSGQVDIFTLPVYPLQYRADAELIKEDLVTRGKKFIKLCHSTEGSRATTHMEGSRATTHMDYCGPVWIQRKPREREGCKFFDTPERMVLGRVMIDPVGYISEHPQFRNNIVAKSLYKTSRFKNFQSDSDTDAEAPDNFEHVDIKSLTNEDLMTFPSRIGGYSLATKAEGFFQVDGFKPINWETARVENFYQSSRRMRSVLHIASGFSFPSDQVNFEIRSKGSGLVFLLFGPSGTGKTLTAECVAERLQCPLYRVSGSDLGFQPSEMEVRLIRAFDRSSRWGAVLLFDEADAFMAKRSDDSLERNSIVSVLLRLIEYQTGIVILTTNRIKDFDSAFQSRIHLSIEYKTLTPAERKGIWRYEFDQAGWNAHTISDADIERLGQLDLDGRTIKNVVHVSKLLIAAKKDATVSLSLLKQTLEIATGNIEGGARKAIEEFCNTTG